MGKNSQPMPAIRTYNRACKQARLLLGLRPTPWQTTAGSIGSNRGQTSSGTSATKSVSFIAGTSGWFQLYRCLRQLPARVLSGSSKLRRLVGITPRINSKEEISGFFGSGAFIPVAFVQDFAASLQPPGTLIVVPCTPAFSLGQGNQRQKQLSG